MSQPYFEAVAPGDEIGPLIVQPTREEVLAFIRLTRLSGAFLSDEAAQREGLPRMILASWQTSAYLAQLLTTWMGPQGFLSRFEIFFRRLVETGDRLECWAIVTDTVVRDGRAVVMLDTFMQNQHGERPLQGTAEVVLPLRGQGGPGF